MAVGPMREHAIIEHARHLEHENIVLREALEKVERHGPIMGSGGDYRQAQLDILADTVRVIMKQVLLEPRSNDPPERQHPIQIVLTVQQILAGRRALAQWEDAVRNEHDK